MAGCPATWSASSTSPGCSTGSSGTTRTVGYSKVLDLVVIACSAPIDGRITHAALCREVTRRTAHGVDLTLPSKFTVPDRSSWASGYLKEAKQARGLDERYRTLKGAEPLADRFISPCSATESGTAVGRTQLMGGSSS